MNIDGYFMKIKMITIVVGLVMTCLSATAQTAYDKAQMEVAKAIETFSSVLSGATTYYVDTFNIQKVSSIAINSMLNELSLIHI